MKITNVKGITPNVLHFHGQNKDQLTKTFNFIFEEHEVNADYDKTQLTIVSTWTSEDDCYLYQQCKRFGIPLVNCVPDDYDSTQEWYMPNKIHFFIDTLKKINTEFVLFLDGYDVLITQLNDIVDRFLAQRYRILFNPSCNNYPNVHIDNVHNRFALGPYRFFNAGCVIGHREDLLKFYTEALEFIDIENEKKSEQYILRQVFAKYSFDLKQNFVGVDWDCAIFQSMGVTDSSINFAEKTITLTPNRWGEKVIIVTGSDGFIGKALVEELRTDPKNIVYTIDRKSGQEADSIDYLLSTRNIDIVYHLAAQTSVFNDNIEQIKKDNIDSFIRVCDLCYKYGAKLIYASSSTAHKSNMTSFYGLSKRFDEDYAKLYNPYSVGVRLHNVYGDNPREGTLMWHILNDEQLVLYNNGENKRYFTCVEYAVQGLLAAMYCPSRVVNCFEDKLMTTKEFADMIIEKYNLKKTYTLSPEIRDKDKEIQQIDHSLKKFGFNA